MISGTIHKNASLVLKVGSLLVALMGFAVLVGWYTKQQFLIQIHHSFAPMQYNTALCFLLSGLGFFLLAKNKIITPAIFGFTVLAFGLLTMLEYVFDIDIGIDQMFMDHYITTKTSHIGRMAPNTAMCFMLMGLALLLGSLLTNQQVRKNSLRFVAAITAVLGGVTIGAYVLGLEENYGWTNLTRMALHASMGFLTLGVSIFFYTYDKKFFSKTISSNSQGFAVRVSLFASIVLLLFSFLLWEEVSKSENEYIKQKIANEQLLLASSISSDMNHSIRALKRMGQRWEVDGGTPYEKWKIDAKNYIEDSDAISSIEWVDKNYFVRWAIPIKDNESAIGYNIVMDEEISKIVYDAADSMAPRLTSKVNIAQGYDAFIAYIPLNVKNKFAGFIAGVYDIDKFFDIAIHSKNKENFHITITDGDGALYFSGNALETKFSAKKDIEIYNRTWSILLTPKKLYLNSQRSKLPEIILITGSLLSIMLCAAIYYGLLSRGNNKLLQDANSFMGLIMESNPDFVFVKDKELRILQANQAFINIYPPEKQDQIIGYTTLEEYQPEEAEEFVKGDRIAFEKGYSESREEIHLPNGDKCILFVQKIRFENAENESFILCIGRDITDKEDLILKLTKSNEDLEGFAQIASHDLKEPLRAIQNHSGFMLDNYAKKLDEEGEKKLNRIMFLTVKMEKLISDLLHYSKLGNQKLELKEFSLDKAVHSIGELLADNEDFEIIVPKKLPRVVGNKAQITEALRNLITNSMKYNTSEAKRVEINVKNTTRSGRSFVLLSLKDNGIGIAEKFHESIFEMFKRLHKEDAYGGGTGAGLGFVRKIVERHGGEIWLESEKGKGSTFFITLPKG